MRSKARLTITLPNELLNQIDGLVDGRAIRNRSHAIELLIRDSLKPRVDTAVILAGGRSDDPEPPPLRLIDGRSLIAITIEHLARYGITNLILLAGPHQAAIRAIIGRGERLGVRVTYVDEPQPSGTAGAVKLAEPYLHPGPFLVVHGDILTTINLSDFIAFHKSEATTASMAVKPRQAERSYGQVMLQGNRITDFYENGQDAGISIVNTGVYLLEPAVLNLITAGQPARLETDVFPQLAQVGELSAFFFQGIWYDISKPGNYRQAKMRYSRERR